IELHAKRLPVAQLPSSAAARAHFRELGIGASGTFHLAPTAIACRLTPKFSGGMPLYQHAGAHDLFEQSTRSPAAEHSMCPGSLQRLIRRPSNHSGLVDIFDVYNRDATYT